jgi:hypothetical protein
MSMADEVSLSEAPPTAYERSQVVLRGALVVALCVLGAPIAWGFGALYLLLPLVAAVAISGRGSAGYLAVEGRRVRTVICWWTAFVAYLLFLSDRFPLERAQVASVRVAISSGANATVGTALQRLVVSLPVLLVLIPLWWVAGVLALVASVAVLVGGWVPRPLLRYFSFVTLLQARLLAYHALLTPRHPFIDAAAPYPAH